MQLRSIDNEAMLLRGIIRCLYIMSYHPTANTSAARSCDEGEIVSARHIQAERQRLAAFSCYVRVAMSWGELNCSAFLFYLSMEGKHESIPPFGSVINIDFSVNT